MRKPFLLFLILLWMMPQVRSQKPGTGTAVGFVTGAGRILRNYPAFPDRGPSLFAGLDLTYSTRGTSPWQYYFRYPDAGVMLWYGYQGNDAVLGRTLGLCPYLGFYLSPPGNRIQYYLRAGLGFAWFTNPYDRITNPENLLAGSHLSNITTLEFYLATRLSSNWEWMGGAGFMHFSNGHTQLPNLGTNIPVVLTGMRYKPMPDRQIPDTSGLHFPGEWMMNIETGMGWHEFGESTEPTGGAKYPVYSLGIYMSRHTHPVHLWHAGVFVNYYTSFHEFIVSQEVYSTWQRIHASTVIAYFGHEFLAGHIGIDTRVGIYLWNPFRKTYSEEILRQPEPLKMINANKLGLVYYFFNPLHYNRNLFVGMHIKSNLGQADFVEFSAGFRF